MTNTTTRDRFATRADARTELTGTGAADHHTHRGRIMMTEPEAWRAIARHLVEDDVHNLPLGLCMLVHHLHWDGSIDRSTRSTMGHRVRGHLNDRAYAYGRPSFRSKAHTTLYVNKYRKARALAALWLALEAEEEEQP